MDGSSELHGFESKPASDNGTLKERARALIRAGILPNRPPDRMWGGAGSEDRCVVCSGSVTSDQTCLEIEYTRHDGAGTSNHHLHVRCYAALEAEFGQLQPDPGLLTRDEPARPLSGGREGA